MNRILCAALVVMAVSAADAQQTGRDNATTAPKPIRATVAGTVVTADTNRPVRRAMVTLTSTTPRLVRSAQSDDRGDFSFADLPAGEYTLSVAKGGFIESIYGQKHPGSGRPGTPLRISEGQKLGGLSLPLARGAVITGTVVDETGEPAFGISVQALRWGLQAGHRGLTPAGSATTDDRGMYRLHSLFSGEYVISAVPMGSGLTLIAGEGDSYKRLIATLDFAMAHDATAPIRLRMDGEMPPDAPSGFARVFYPGTTAGSAATTIALGPGEERSAVDVAMQVVPLARVGGVVMGPNGPVSGASVQLVEDSELRFSGPRTARTDASGRFGFAGIAPGQYVLATKASPKGAPQLEASGREAAEYLASATDAAKAREIAAAIQRVAPLWAMSNISVDGRNQTDLQLTLQPGLTVSGQVTTDKNDPTVNLSRMTLNLAPVNAMGEFSQAIPGTVDANGQFTIRGVTPGSYRLTTMAGVPAGYVLQSAVFGGTDILDFPMEVDGGRNVAGGVVTLSSRSTEVTGTVRDASNQPAAGFTVIVFATESRFWVAGSRRIQAVRPSTDGRYQFRNLPEGDYRIIAVPDVEPGRWFDPDFLRQLTGFANFSLAAGGKHTQDFQVR